VASVVFVVPQWDDTGANGHLISRKVDSLVRRDKIVTPQIDPWYAPLSIWNLCGLLVRCKARPAMGCCYCNATIRHNAIVVWLAGMRSMTEAK